MGGRLSDLGWLVTGDPEQVLSALDGAAGQEEVLAAAVYRASGHVHRDAAAGARRQVLALDAARYGNLELARSIAGVAVRQEADDPWVVQWATGCGLDSRLRYALPAPAKAGVVATVVVEGRGLAVVGCEDGALHWWDLATGRALGKIVTEHPGAVRALATAVLDGRPVAVTSGSDGAVRVWDLAEGEQVGAFHATNDSWVTSLATAVVEGRPVAVGASTDGVVQVWDLAALSQHGEPLTVHTGFVSALATAVLGGRPVAVTSHSKELGALDPITGEETLRLWDLVTGLELRPLSDRSEWPPVFADQASDRPTATSSDNDGEAGHCVSLDLNAKAKFLVTDPASECPMAVSANTYEVHVWNLATGEQVGEPVPGFVGAAAVRVLHGRPAALVAFDKSVEVWDLSTLRHLVLPLTGHDATVRGAATAVLKGRPLAVTADDGSVRIWDLDGERDTGNRPTVHAGPVQEVTTSVVDGRSVIVTLGSDTKVRVWDLDGKGQLGEPLPTHSDAVRLMTVRMVNGQPTLITRDRQDTVRIWDLTTREELRGQATTEYTSSYIGFFAAVDGRFVGVTWEGRVWDLTVNKWIGVQPRQEGALALETLEGRNVILTGRSAEALHLWDLATGEPLGPPLTGHTRWVQAGAVGMLDGRLVVAAGDDRIVRMWDATTGQQIGTYTFPARITGLSVAPSGRLVVGFGPDIAVLTHRDSQGGRRDEPRAGV